MKKICLPKSQNTSNWTIRPNAGMLLHFRTCNWKVPSLPNQDDMLQYRRCAQQRFRSEEISPLKQNGLFAASSHHAEKVIHTTAGKSHPSITELIHPWWCESIIFSSIEITNRCNCMQWILFLCLIHSTCFGRHTRPSSGVQLYLQPLVQS